MADTTSNLTAVFKARDEASKEVKKVEGSLSGLGSALSKAGIAAAAFGAAAAAALGAFAISSVKEFSEVGDAVEKMSIRTGLSAESVSALRVAADMGGTSIETVEGAAKKMQLTMVSAKGASDGMKDAFKGIGMSINDIFAKGVSPDTKFELLGNAIANTTDPMLRTQLAIEAFGKSGTDLLPMFEGGNFSMAAWSEQAKKLGVSFDELSAKHAAELNDAIGAMGTAWTGLKMKVGGELAPVITGFINDQLIPMAEKTLAALPSISELKKGFDNMKVGFVQAVNEFDQKTGIITALREGFEKIWSQIQTQLVPALQKLWEANKPLMPYYEALGKVIAGVLVVSIRILIEVVTTIIGKMIDFATWQANTQAAILEFSKPAIDLITGVFKGMGDQIFYVIGKLGDFKRAAIDAYNWAAKAASMVNSATPSGMISNAIGALSGRAMGGSVTAGTPYIVGENGRELFVPNQSGTIVSNSGLKSSGSGASININIGNFFGGNPELAARDLGDLIIKRLQMNARV